MIDGKNLSDIQPDEDSIGEMIYKKNPHWLYNWAVHILHPSTLKLVMQGDYESWAHAGKMLVRKMNDYNKLALIDQGQHVQHGGHLKFKEAWRLKLTDNSKLNKDGSNFFEIAERIY